MVVYGKIVVSMLLRDIVREKFWRFFYGNIFLRVLGF